ncbi:MAG: hypothetical protein Q8Q73_10500 [Stagnimonas sp.]|nr:hypothetical protein [Stagnimonas sp.]
MLINTSLIAMNYGNRDVYEKLAGPDNRILLSQGVKSTGSNGVRTSAGVNLAAGELGISTTQGTWLEYDGGGNRSRGIQYEKEGTTDVLVTRLHTYEASNRIASSYYQSPTVAQRITTNRGYNTQGRMIDYSDYGTTGAGGNSRRTMSYDSNGRLQQQNYYNSNFITVNVVVDYKDTATNASWYDGAGNLLKYQSKGITGSTYTQTYQYSYLRIGGGYKEAYIYGSGQADQGGFAPGSTTTTYDRNGNIVSVNQTGQTYRSFVTDPNGQILKKIQGGATQTYAYANGSPIGSFSSDPNVKADFDYNYTPVSDSYPPATPGQYVTQPGDTLQKVAYSVYGDASLWYLIADANGLTSATGLPSGLALNIPNQITNLRNANDTFKPYSPGEIIGDTTPELKYIPPPPPKKKCGGLLTIIIVAVSVIATVVTAGALGPATGPLMAAAIGAASAAAGSVAGQLAGMALGVQSGFSFSAVARAAVIGGVTAGLTTGAGQALGTAAEGGKAATFLTMSGRAGAMAQAVVNNAIGQGVNMALGNQKKFSWSSVAASAVTAGIMGGKTGDSKTDNLPAVKEVSKGFWSDLGSSAASQLLNRTTQIVLDGGGKLNLANIAADSFGNALGNSIVGKIQERKQEQLDNEFKQLSPAQQGQLQQMLQENPSLSPQKAIMLVKELASTSSAAPAMRAQLDFESNGISSGLAESSPAVQKAIEVTREAEVLNQQAEAQKVAGEVAAYDAIEGGDVDGPDSLSGYGAKKTIGDRWRNEDGRYAKSPGRYDPVANRSGAQGEFDLDTSIAMIKWDGLGSGQSGIDVLGDGNQVTLRSSYDLGSGQIALSKDSATASASLSTASEVQYATREYGLGDFGAANAQVRSAVELGGTGKVHVGTDGADISLAIQAEAVLLQARGEYKTPEFANDYLKTSASFEGALNAGAIGGSGKAFAQYNSGKFSAGLAASANVLIGAKAGITWNVDVRPAIQRISNPLAPVGSWLGIKLYDWTH